MSFGISEIYSPIDQASERVNKLKAKDREEEGVGGKIVKIAEGERERELFAKYLFIRRTILTMYGRNSISCFQNI